MTDDLNDWWDTPPPGTFDDPFAVKEPRPARPAPEPAPYVPPKRTGPTPRTLRIRAAQRNAPCPECDAATGDRCTNPDGSTRDTNHKPRIAAARKRRAEAEAFYNPDRYGKPEQPIGPRYGLGNDHYGRAHDPEPGRLTRGSDPCHRCGEPMVTTASITKDSRGRWIHRACAPGADDE